MVFPHIQSLQATASSATDALIQGLVEAIVTTEVPANTCKAVCSDV
jgi:hypothetical protein